MEYIVLISVFVSSVFLAYCTTLVKLKFYEKIVGNLLTLLICAFIILITGLKETSLLVYFLLLITTLCGILMRIISPIVLNIIGNILSKTQNETYTPLSYEELMQSGNKMYFCVLAFTTYKVLLYIALGASFLNLI